jgi:hypothetical protein
MTTTTLIPNLTKEKFYQASRRPVVTQSDQQLLMKKSVSLAGFENKESSKSEKKRTHVPFEAIYCVRDSRMTTRPHPRHLGHSHREN